ncbi:hypothetical protein GCM10025865_25750 [Paraoerskovia sediminicola]|uniref:SPOR domain-containing protein n=1 Tax=Paraoerskovia sediminicola TaxID=1138587 RepID=A0ABM8G548_9CELL|nr:SPOR domain-containing protein [Paraoerskovia sediminicola]BDZ43276.1 hypothetical protein GCM10025865_25750 [Paraoerskovia sediminicola]
MSTEFFYDTRTGEVTEGRTTGWRGRMGPYATREEAENALSTASERTQEWDDEQDYGDKGD